MFHVSEFPASFSFSCDPSLPPQWRKEVPLIYDQHSISSVSAMFLLSVQCPTTKGHIHYGLHYILPSNSVKLLSFAIISLHFFSKLKCFCKRRMLWLNSGCFSQVILEPCGYIYNFYKVFELEATEVGSLTVLAERHDENCNSATKRFLTSSDTSQKNISQVTHCILYIYGYRCRMWQIEKGKGGGVKRM